MSKNNLFTQKTESLFEKEFYSLFTTDDITFIKNSLKENPTRNHAEIRYRQKLLDILWKAEKLMPLTPTKIKVINYKKYFIYNVFLCLYTPLHHLRAMVLLLICDKKYHLTFNKRFKFTFD